MSAKFAFARKAKEVRKEMTQEPAIQFLFPGQGSERVNMTRVLYEALEFYRREVDACCSVVDDLLGFSLKDILFPESSEREAAVNRLEQTSVAQPALFTIEYSLARFLASRGVEPRGMLGHSVGEYVAACLAGVFSRETALEIVVKRGRLVQELPPGKMLAVALPASELTGHLNDRIDLGSTLGVRQCVVSGFPDSVDELRVKLREQGIGCAEVAVNRAFHSMMLDPVLEEFREFVNCRQLHPPEKRCISGVSGKWIDAERAREADYWVDQLRMTKNSSWVLWASRRARDSLLMPACSCGPHGGCFVSGP